MRRCTRRRAIKAAGIGLSGVLAGCSALQSDAPEESEPSYDRLDVTAVYAADGVDLSMPSEVSTVDNAYNADLLVLPGDTSADAEQVVEWFADERVVALLGEEAESTWLSWVRSDAFDEHFENRGYGDAQPDPRLVVGARIGLYVTTYRYSWGSTPDDGDVLDKLDESLVKVDQETPPG